MTVPSIRRLTSAAMTAALLLLALAPGASATIRERTPYSFSDVIPAAYACSGVPVTITVEGSGTFIAREGKGKDDTAFFGHDVFRVTETHELGGDPDDAFVITLWGTFQETRATRVSGNVFEFHAIVAIQADFRDDDGELLLRDRGVIRVGILFDTGGDDVIGGTFVDLLYERISGLRPSFETDFCTLLD